MYEYVRKPGGLGALGTDDVYEMMERLRDGTLTEGQVTDICANLSHQQLTNEWAPCRRWIDPATYCRMDTGATCSADEIATTCYMLPEAHRHPSCARHLASLDPGASVDPEAWRQELEESSSWLEEGVETVQSVVHRLRPRDSQVEALQRAITAAGCTLPQYGVDGRWGSETEAGVRCLAAQQSWQQVAQQFPLVAQRMTVPSEAAPTQVAQQTQTTEPTSISSKIAAAVKSVFSPMPTAPQPAQVQTAAMLPSIPMPSGLPSWVPWAAGGFGLLGLIVLGAYLTGRKEKELEEAEEPPLVW